MQKVNRKFKCPSQKLGQVTLLILFVILGVILMYPLVITFTNSLMGQSEIKKHYMAQTITMKLIPDRITLEAYKNLLFTRPQYLMYFWNSVKITGAIIIGQLIISIFAAYGFTVAKFKGKNIIFWIYIIIMLLPTQVTLVPSYMVITKLNLINHYLALILPGIFNPFGTFLLTAYMKDIPKEYMEAAQMDGASNMQTLGYVFLPILKSGVFAVVMLTLIEYWNIVEQALVLIRDLFKQPLSIYLSYIGEEPSMVFAASCFYMFPVLWGFLYGHEYLVQGLELSGVKG